jgi:RNA polymerase sigma factor (sigma-70 family)
MNAVHTHENNTHLKHTASIAEIAIKSPGRLKNFLRRWEKDESEMEDIIAEALLNAWQSLDSFNGESSIETWFFGVCKNTARQHVASKVRLSTFISYVDEFDELAAALDDNVGLPLDEELSLKETLQQVEKSVSALPSDLQYVFQTIYMEGRQYHDVAQQLGIPLGTLKSRVNRMHTNLIGA